MRNWYRSPALIICNRRGHRFVESTRFYRSLESRINTVRTLWEKGLLIVIDLDSFRSFNDTHGHAAVDFVLQTVANKLRKCVRQIDNIARISSDEFAVLINQPYPKPTIKRSQVISEVLNELEAPWAKQCIQVRANIGV